MLLIPAFVGIIIFVWQIINFFNKSEELDQWTEAFNTPLNCIYAIFVILWTTYFVESWKRKESKLADMWLMRDFEDPTLEREEFKSAYLIDQETKSTDKVSRIDTHFRQIYVGIPVSVFFIFLVILTQLFMRAWADSNAKEYGTEIPLHLEFTPSIVNTVLIVIYGAVYKIVADYLVHAENHRYETAHEDSLINKMYMFQFINSYISNYIIAYWVRDFSTLVTNLVTIMVGKQIGANIAEWAQAKFLVGRKIKAVNTRFAERKNEKNVDEIVSKEGIDRTIALEEISMH